MRVCVCAYIYIYTYIYIHTRVQVRVYMCVSMYVCTAPMYVHTQVCMYARRYACMFWMYACIYVGR